MLKLKIYFLLLLFFAFNSCSSQSDDNSEDSSLQHREDKIYTEANHNLLGDSALRANLNNIIATRKNAITNAVEKCSPAIVGINVTEVRRVEYRDPFFDDPFFGRFFGFKQKPRYREYEVQGIGSGFLISSDGYILTNHHVAGDASKIIITMTNGETYDADIIGADLVSDVALLKIKGGSDFPYLKLSSSEDVITGEWVIAFGNPFGLFNINAKPTVTVGVISNIGINFSQEGRVYRGMIQTDAAISSGNSGGPLVNSLGEVIGINTVIFSTAQSREGAGSIGIGFAIPINRVKHIINLLKTHGKINRNFYIGMEITKNDKQLQSYFDLESSEGVVVTSIRRNSPAEKAGIEPGDIILEIDGYRLNREDDYNVIVNDGIVGQKLKFNILRGSEKIDISLILKEFSR